MFLLTCEDFFAHLRLSPDSNSNPAGEFKLIRQLATSLLPQMFTLNCFFTAHRSNNHEFTCLNQPLSQAFCYQSITSIQQEKLTFFGTPIIEIYECVALDRPLYKHQHKWLLLSQWHWCTLLIYIVFIRQIYNSFYISYFSIILLPNGSFT